MTLNGIKEFFETVNKQENKIESVVLNDNIIDDECMKAVGEFIQRNKTLKKIELSKSNPRIKNGNNITDKGVEILVDTIAGNTTLRELILDGYKGITTVSIPYLAELATKTYVKEISIEKSSLLKNELKKLKDIFQKPFNSREIPINSKTKSAAKLS